MVMGPTHAIMGFGAGLLAAEIAPAAVGVTPSIPVALTFATITAGASIVSDLDHPSATAARSLGAITGSVAWFLHHLSGFIYRHTRTDEDSRRDGKHRGITHTVPGALVAGGTVAAACHFGGLWGTLACLFLFALFALRALPPKEAPGTDCLMALGLAALGYWVLPADRLTAWFGAAVVLGVIVHCIGDGLTEAGVPLGFPLVIAGQRWYPVRTPAPIRFRAAGPGDRVVRFLSVCGVLVLLLALVPGAWGLIFDVAGRAWHNVAAWRTG